MCSPLFIASLRSRGVEAAPIDSTASCKESIHVYCWYGGLLQAESPICIHTCVCSFYAIHNTCVYKSHETWWEIFTPLSIGLRIVDCIEYSIYSINILNQPIQLKLHLHVHQYSLPLTKQSIVVYVREYGLMWKYLQWYHMFNRQNCAGV